MNMYHNKEIMNSKLSIIGDLPESEAEREEPTLSKIRFGELEVGDKFVFDGCWLVKTSEYRAESDKKRGKNHFLFFKKDIVQHEYLGDICHDEIDNHLLLHENGSDQATKFFTPKTGRFADKYDLFDSHFDTIKRWQNSEKPQCEIVITPGKDRHHVEVLGNDGYRWETTFKCNLNESWYLPLRLKHYEFILMYDCKEIQLYAEEKKIWCKDFLSWDMVHTCSIRIKDIRLEPGDE